MIFRFSGHIYYDSVMYLLTTAFKRRPMQPLHHKPRRYRKVLRVDRAVYTMFRKHCYTLLNVELNKIKLYSFEIKYAPTDHDVWR